MVAIIYILIILLILLILFLLSLSYISADISFHRIKEDDNIEIKASMFFGIIKFKYSMPYIDLILGRDLKPEIKVKSRMEKRIQENILKSKGRLNFKYLTEQYGSMFEPIIKKTKLDYIKWHTTIGLSDAALTAVVYGLFWSVKCNLLNLISKYNFPDKVDIDIIPDYSRLIFETEIRCIIRIKIANIIITRPKIIFLVLKKVFQRRGEGNE